MPIGRSRAARVLPRWSRHGALAALGALLIATLVPGAVVAADPSPAPDRSSGIATILRQRTPDRGVAVDPVPAGTVGVRSSVGFFYSDGSIAVVGEVLNNTPLRRGSVGIQVTYYNGNDAVVGAISDAVLLDRVSRGAVGPILLFDQSPPLPGCRQGDAPATCIGAYAIRVRPNAAAPARASGVLQIPDSSNSVAAGVRTFTGTIRNPNAFAVTNVTVMVTAYNAQGNVIDTTYDLPNGGALGAGSSAPYTMEIAVSDEPGLAYHHSAIHADAYRSGTTDSYVTSWSNYFDDLGTSFRGDIVWIAEQGITGGCGTGRYCPTANVRRDEMASFLARALGLTGTAPDAFTDDNGNTHELNINKLAAAGITGGCGAKKYCPSASVRRDQMASFLARAVGLDGPAPNAFTDDNGNTHERSINRLAAAGITAGCGGGKYCPTVNVTRAQMAAFLRRAFQ